MEKPHLLNFVSDGGGDGGGGPVGGSVAGGGAGGDYTQIASSDSDDSRSSISRSDENETLPCIIYTSDDSADVGQSDSTCCIDSEGMDYIAHDVHQIQPQPRIQDDEGSRRLLLDSGCPSPQPSPQADPIFTVAHPLAAITFSTGSDPELGVGADLGLQAEPGTKLLPPVSQLAVGNSDCNFERSTSVSSDSSGSSPEAQVPLLPEYHQLPNFTDFPDIQYEPLTDGANIANKKLHDPLDIFVDVLEIVNKIQPHLGRCMVGDDLHISAKYKDAFYVKWNWNRIRHSCMLLNLSVLICLLCVGIGLLVQMPKGSECNPSHMWWQGSVMYEIYVPSFQDTDNDGVGDLPGILNRIDYLKNIGIKAIRLNSVLETRDYLHSLTPVTNYTAVDPIFGSNKDLHLLAAVLHEKEMYLLMDIPLNFNTSPNLGADVNDTGMAVNQMKDRHLPLSHVSEGLRYWLSLGVDGFFFPDIAKFMSESELLEAMHEWRNTLDRFSHGTEHRVMMVPLGLLSNLKTANSLHLDRVLHLVDLIDAPVDLTGSAQTIPEVLNSTTAWDTHASLPWINWNMGGMRRERVHDLTNNHPLGRTFLLLFFPGTVTLYYGDEIGLSGASEAPLSVGQTTGMECDSGSGWASIMQWNDDVGAGFSSAKPWQSLGKGWEEANVNAQNDTIAALKAMVTARQEKVPMYINGIFDYKGDYHPTKTSNYRIRYADEDLIVIDRFFPRRNQFAIVANLGQDVLTKDLSHLYFGGSVLASSHGHSGYVKFRSISLQPGEALVCILDL
ncbi:neutral and basic amino acid transport protein rBAT-like isoform X2 [Penaeus japonicus]|uniref:neutral and basic amino acid transport protein rBAT-like isoform X2 n=1 Tax=Penaeus japonicus TaxID=27405 RepID=UPI001C70EEEC|nr:neutral and basic amino acid transport protein rBAT-like isoform X2 [Penaeus japonicus]